MPSPLPIVALGELLWDLLPGGRKAGGAPFNFAFHCYQLGHPAVIVSRVGGDGLGRELRAEVRRLGMCDEYIQTDHEHPTGTVTVDIGPGGQPAFSIVDDVAWDYIELEPRLEALASSARAVCYGTLGQRRPVSRAAVRKFLRTVPESALRVCDINLRPPFQTSHVTAVAARKAKWLKLNDSEIWGVEFALGNPRRRDRTRGAVAGAGFLLDATELDLVAITRGAHGCLVRSRTETIDLPGIAVTVADTVGAGDAFTAALLTQHLEGKALREAARFANAYAAVVASKPGGTPHVERAEVERLL
jgi:fructokinase